MALTLALVSMLVPFVVAEVGYLVYCTREQ